MSTLLPDPAVEALIMPDAAAVVYVGRQGQQREVLAIHVVLQIENARESGAGNFRLIPGAVGALRCEEKTQPALHTRAIKIAACAKSHQRPRGLGGGACAFTLQVRILVGSARFAPAAVIILATL